MQTSVRRVAGPTSRVVAGQRAGMAGSCSDDGVITFDHLPGGRTGRAGSGRRAHFSLQPPNPDRDRDRRDGA